MNTIHVYMDGGCRNNGTEKAEGYCSVRIIGRKDTLYSVDLANAKTNNQAEYGAWICALDLISGDLIEWKKRHTEERVEVIFHSDSELMLSQVVGFFKTRKASLKKLNEAVCDGLRRLKDAGVEWHVKQEPREVLVAKLGH